MLRKHSFVIYFLFSLFLLCSPTLPAGSSLPHPWIRSFWNYKVGVDPTVGYDGQPSYFIDYGPLPTPPHQIGPGRFTVLYDTNSGICQSIKADRCRRRRMRWAAYLRTDRVADVWDITGPETRRLRTSLMANNLEYRKVRPGAGLYVLLDSKVGTLLYAMTGDGTMGTADRLRGTTDWSNVEMIFDVPSQTMVITIGFFLAGTGKIWANRFRFDEVGSSIETTEGRDLDLTETQIYKNTFALHKKRLRQYSNLQEAPIFSYGKKRT